MKVTITTDMTPQEARQLMGLPDVQPMQKAAMEAVEQRVRDQVAKFTGDGLIESWLGQSPKVTELFGGVFERMAKAGKSSEPSGS